MNFCLIYDILKMSVKSDEPQILSGFKIKSSMRIYNKNTAAKYPGKIFFLMEGETTKWISSQ